MHISILKALRSSAFLSLSLPEFTQNDFYRKNSFTMKSCFCFWGFFCQTTFSRLRHSTEHVVAIRNLQIKAHGTKSHDKQTRRLRVKRVGRKSSGSRFRAPSHLRAILKELQARSKSWPVEIVAASGALRVKVHTPRHPCCCYKTSWSPDTLDPWLPQLSPPLQSPCGITQKVR